MSTGEPQWRVKGYGRPLSSPGCSEIARSRCRGARGFDVSPRETCRLSRTGIDTVTPCQNFLSAVGLEAYDTKYTRQDRERVREENQNT